MNKLRTAEEIFEEELSGEPLSQDVVIEAIQIAQREIYNSMHKMVMSNKSELHTIKDQIGLTKK